MLWDRLFRLKQQGVTLILTTHYMDEAEQLCDRLVVMDHGRIVAEGSPRELIAAHATREVLELRLRRRRAGRRPRSDPGRRRGPRSRSCPTGCSGTPTTARRPWPGATALGVAAGHRAGATLHIGGCLPRADRPDAGGLMSTRACAGLSRVRVLAAALPADLARHRRDQRRQPVAVPDRHRRRARPADRPTSAALGGVSYLAFFAPGMLAAAVDAERHHRVGLPGRLWPAGGTAATRSPAPARSSRPTSSSDTCCSWRSRSRIGAAAFLVVMVAMGAARSPLVAAGPAGRAADRARVRHPDRRLGRSPWTSPAPPGTLFKWVVMPLYLFSGTFFPIEQLPTWLRGAGLRVAAVARRRPVPHAEPRHGHAGRCSAVHVAYLLALTAVGCSSARAPTARQLHVAEGIDRVVGPPACPAPFLGAAPPPAVDAHRQRRLRTVPVPDVHRLRHRPADHVRPRAAARTRRSSPRPCSPRRP